MKSWLQLSNNNTARHFISPVFLPNNDTEIKLHYRLDICKNQIVSKIPWGFYSKCGKRNNFDLKRKEPQINLTCKYKWLKETTMKKYPKNLENSNIRPPKIHSVICTFNPGRATPTIKPLVGCFTTQKSDTSCAKI